MRAPSRRSRTDVPPTLSVSEVEDLQVVEPVDCATCGSTPSARPAAPAPDAVHTCPSCGSRLEVPIPSVPPMSRRAIWRDYDAPLEEVRQALMERISMIGFRHDAPASGEERIAFRTGMTLHAYGTKMVAELRPYPDRTRVVMRGRLRGPQFYGWGVVEDVARRVFHAMDRSQLWTDRVLDENLRDPRRIWLNLGAGLTILSIWVGIYLFLR